MYRPGLTYPENPALEFIEIHNPDTDAVNLSGWRITSGPDFVFPSGTIVPANGFVVIAADPVALQNAGAIGTIVGPWKSGSKLSKATPTNLAARTWNGVPFTDAEVATLATVADLDHMARWFAVMTIIQNTEPNISNDGDRRLRCGLY